MIDMVIGTIIRLVYLFALLKNALMISGVDVSSFENAGRKAVVSEVEMTVSRMTKL